MIDKLKRKFIVTATVCMFFLMTALVLIMNIVNYCGVVSESNAILDVLSRPDAPLFIEENLDEGFPPEIPENMRGFVPSGMSLEVPFESRFFIVTVSKDGEILQSDLSRIISVDENSAKQYIDRALNSKKDRGFVGDFRYSRTADEMGTRILFLDCGRKLDTFRDFLWISIVSGLFGCVAVFLAFVLTAGKIVAPIAESYEKQKRFISDAGHEIKTPLTIINANVDLLESDGENEELADIRDQVRRLTELTNNLVLLSKMEEAEHTLRKTEVSLSDLVSSTAGSFRAPAALHDIDFTVRITPDLTIVGSADTLRQMVSVLLDNAVKYSPEGGRITLELAAHKKKAVLTITNATKDKVDEKDLQYVFDRFYRTDTSRNSMTGGHGIGLSIARAIAGAHGGTISASTESGQDFCVTVALPL